MDNLVTVNDLCKMLKVTRTTITNWRKEGMPFIKIGKLVRFDKETVEEWLKTKK